MCVLGYIQRGTGAFDTSTSINLNQLYIHQSKYNMSSPPYIDTYAHIPLHVPRLVISLWEPANSLFVRDKYVTPTGKQLHARYVQNVEARKTHTI